MKRVVLAGRETVVAFAVQRARWVCDVVLLGNGGAWQIKPRSSAREAASKP